MSSKGSLVLARLKQTVGIGQHTEDNELQEAIERLNHALAEAQGLRIKLVKLKGAVTATNTARAAVMASVVSSSGVDTTQGAVVDRLNKVVSVYAHQDGDLAEALGTVYDQVVLGEANEWCSSLEALQAAVEAHEVDRVKCVAGVHCFLSTHHSHVPHARPPCAPHGAGTTTTRTK